MEKELDILIIEDDSGDALLISEMLDSVDAFTFFLKEAKNLNEGLELIQNDSFDIVITDLGLPDSQGIETSSSLLEVLKGTPLIVLTGNDNQQLGIEALSNGAQDYLVKGSIDADQLFRSIRYAIQRKKVEEELRISEEQYRILFENAHEAIVVMADGVTKYFNPKIRELTGYSFEELKSLVLSDIIFPADMELLMDYHSRRLQGEDVPSNYDVRIYNKNKEIRYLEINAVMIEWAGEPAVLAFLNDITDRRNAEEALKEREAFVTTILDNIPDQIFVKDAKELKFIRYSKGGEKIIGYSEEELLGKSDYDFFPKEQADFFTRKDREVLNKGNLLDIPEEVIKTKHNGERILHTKKIPVFSKDGKPQYLLGISEDITDRIKAEKTLQKSEATLKSIFRAAPIGIGMVRDRILMMVNDQMCKMVGYEQNELINKSARLLYETEEEYNRIGKEKYEMIENSGVGIVETTFLCKNGEKKEILLSSSPIDTNNKELGHIFTALDITEQKKSQLALQESEERFRKMAENIDDGLIIIEDGKPVFVNKRACEISGYPKEELIGLRTLDLAAPDEKERIGKYVKMYQENGTFPEYTEFWIQRKDGNRRFLKNRHLSAKNGKNLYYITMTDITEQKIAEQALIEREQKLSNILNSSPDAITYTDLKGRILDYNRAASDLFQLHDESMSGKITIFDFLKDEEKIRVKETLPEFIRKETVRAVEYDFIDNRGRHFPGEISSSLTKDSFGKPIGLVSIIKDITERKKTEESQRKLTKAIEQSPATVVITNAHGEIEYVNPKFSEITGYSNEEVIGKNPNILQSGKTPVDTYADLWKNLQANKEWKGTFQNKKKNGEIYWEEAYISPILDEKGRITHYVAVKEDITERKIYEGELIQSRKKAEEADRLKSAFLTNMSHEIRTPMNAIVGFSQLLKNEEFTNSEKDEFVDIINQKSDDLLQIINDIIDTSLIESGQIRITNKEFTLDPLLDELYNSFSLKSSSEVSINLENEFERDSIHLYTDPGRVKQILNNLLDNALKYTDKGKIDFGYQQDTLGEITFYVKDTGIGIEPEKQIQIFDRFTQANTIDPQARGGNGLGLSITRNLIELLGGRIWVESKKGVGSTFYVSLPYTQEKLTNIGKIEFTDSTNGDFEDKVILVAEDEEANYFLIQQILKKSKAKILHAWDGQEVLEILESEPKIDLILMDIKMPVLDGKETTQIIRKKNLNVPIIAQTAFAMVNDKKICMEAGCDDYLPKPINKEKLLNVLSNYL